MIEPRTRTEKELNMLYEISCAMRTTLDLEHILYIILTGVTAHSGLGFNRAVLFLVEPHSRILQCRMAIGPESGEHADHIWTYIDQANQTLEDLIHEEKFTKTVGETSLLKSLSALHFPTKPDDPSLISQAYNRGSAWHLNAQDLKQFKDDPLMNIFQSRELAIVPTKAKDRVNGLVVADNFITSKPISREDMKVFSMLGNHAGLAIENSRLYEIVVQKSQTDALTGLWNHGFFQKSLMENLESAKRHDQPLSLIVLDIDNFKKLNDTCGHQHGDSILRSFADILRQSSREQDIVCRYGGEEFALILVHTSREQAGIIAERLRRSIDQFSFPSPSGVGHLHFTASLGVASFPHDASSKNDLIALADKAMYQAKFNGKNQVCMS
ncbi:MAG: diguanylate cyclase [Candidatus Omnitrophota bacterium]